MANNKANAPLTPAVLHILLALSTQERHGYGIMKQVESDSQGKVKMGPGTLYGSLGRMIEAGLDTRERQESRPRKWTMSGASTTKSPASDKKRSRRNWSDTARSWRSPSRNAFHPTRSTHMAYEHCDRAIPAAGTQNCSASIRSRTASASAKGWSKPSTISAANGQKREEDCSVSSLDVRRNIRGNY